MIKFLPRWPMLALSSAILSTSLMAGDTGRFTPDIITQKLSFTSAEEFSNWEGKKWCPVSI